MLEGKLAIQGTEKGKALGAWQLIVQLSFVPRKVSLRTM